MLAGLLFTGCANTAPQQEASKPPTAATATSAAQPIDKLAQGKSVYEKTCVACHGPDAKGVKGLGKDMVESKFVKGLSDAQLADFIKKGRDTSDPANTTKVAMPPKGGNPALGDEDMLSVAVYVHSLQKPVSGTQGSKGG